MLFRLETACDWPSVLAGSLPLPGFVIASLRCSLQRTAIQVQAVREGFNSVTLPITVLAEKSTAFIIAALSFSWHSTARRHFQQAERASVKPFLRVPSDCWSAQILDRKVYGPRCTVFVLHNIELRRCRSASSHFLMQRTLIEILIILSVIPSTNYYDQALSVR